MASRVLADSVGYPGSSIAFAQLLSGMERAGVIRREVRGKRTYRITLGDFDGFGPAPRASSSRAADITADDDPDSVAALTGAPGDFDYDELARRLLVQVVRKLAAEPSPTPLPEDTPDPAVVTELEHELASAWTKHGRLAEENIRLREQLRAARQSLAQARERVRRLPLTADLDSSEVVMLQRLLAAGNEGDDPNRPGRGRSHGTIAGW